VDFLRGSACAVVTRNSECSPDFGEARGTTRHRPRPPAIDIVIGGLPCSDDSGVNAYARGAEGGQAQYLIRFATSST
jgi:hypothetical protein